MITPEEMELFLKHYIVIEKDNHIVQSSYISDESLTTFAKNEHHGTSFKFDKIYNPIIENIGLTTYIIINYRTGKKVSELFDTTELRHEIQSLINEQMSELTKSFSK